MAEERGQEPAKPEGKQGIRDLFHDIPTWGWWAIAGAAVIIAVFRLRGSKATPVTGTVPAVVPPTATSADTQPIGAGAVSSGGGQTIIQFPADPYAADEQAIIAAQQAQITQENALLAALQAIIGQHSGGNNQPPTHPPIHIWPPIIQPPVNPVQPPVPSNPTEGQIQGPLSAPPGNYSWLVDASPTQLARYRVLSASPIAPHAGGQPIHTTGPGFAAVPGRRSTP